MVYGLGSQQGCELLVDTCNYNLRVKDTIRVVTPSMQ